MRRSLATYRRSQEIDVWERLSELPRAVGGLPSIEFSWERDTNGKRRLIGHPNRPMRTLHESFGLHLRSAIRAMQGDNFGLILLPSSSAFTKGTNPLKNAERHQRGRYYYITDFANAYPSVNLEKMAALIVYIARHRGFRLEYSLKMLSQNAMVEWEMQKSPVYLAVLGFLESFCAGPYGKGLAVGGPLSPWLFNLYCEVYCDMALRALCQQKWDITYTRYADDNVFSRDKPIIPEIRRELRERMTHAGFEVNHRKSRVLSLQMGTVFVTKVGLRETPVAEGEARKVALVFPKKKRRRLHGIIGSYLKMQMDWPEKVSGYVGEFIHYYKNVESPTKSDKKTFALCKAFEREWAKYRPRACRRA